MASLLDAVRRWLAPLALLRVVRGRTVCLLVAVYVAQAALPLVAAFASRSVVSGAGDLAPGTGAGPVMAAVVALAVVLLVQQVIGVFVTPMHEGVARIIDGTFRRRTAELALAPPGIAHLDDAENLGRFTMATTTLQGIFTPGKAAVSHVAAMCQTVSAIGCAVVLADSSVWLAAAVLLLALVRRSAMQRLFIGLNWLWVRGADQSRVSAHWAQFGGGAPAAKEIRIFGLRDWAIERYRSAVLGQWEPIWQARRRVVVRNWVPLVTAAAMFALGLVAVLPDQGPAAPGEIAQGVTVLLFLIAFSSGDVDAYHVAHGRPALEAAAELARRLTPSAPGAAASGGSPAGQGPPRVRFENVHFAYDPATAPVLRGLDLQIEPGESLAVVGVNGVGKTTLTKLLARLYEPVRGRITADGVDIATIDADTWRRGLAVVVQGSFRYDLSLRENIQLGAPERAGDDAFFSEVSDDLDLDDLVARLPKGWDTPLSAGRTGGTELSGGQWQRVALARALFAVRAGRRLLVMDEPTAHLDAEAELDTFKRVMAAASDAGILLISHRLSTVRLADRIAVIRDGVVSEYGSHDELVSAGGDYAHMFAVQAEQFLGDSMTRSQ